jgi:galactonate dehydratase
VTLTFTLPNRHQSLADGVLGFSIDADLCDHESSDTVRIHVRNPNRPPERVRPGDRSSDEMGQLFIQVLPTNEKDRKTMRKAYLRHLETQKRSTHSLGFAFSTVGWDNEPLMKITALKTFIVHPENTKNWLFIKVETDAGIHGWGEAYTRLDRDRAIEVHAEQLARYLVGRSAFDVKHFTYVAYTDFSCKRGSMDLYAAISAVEQAMWDIQGKASGQPVYNLLGGRCRDRVRVYANGWARGNSSEEIAERATEMVERGFTALKFDPFPGPWRAYIDREEERVAIERVGAVREAVGPDIDILIEVHRRLAPMNAVRVARALEKYQPFWFEEPVSGRDLDSLAEVRRDISLPVVTGEELYTKIEFTEVFQKRAADILNPDVANCGGILELREIAAMAEAHHVAISPHNFNSTTVALAATLQAAAGMPNFLITEYFVNFEAVGRDIAVKPLEVENGTIALPTEPGIGIDLDEEAMARYPYRDFPARDLRQPDDENTSHS